MDKDGGAATSYQIRDPFLDKTVDISSKLTDRLRGRYAVGPTMENGEPEFGWREFEVPPIQKEAADEIDRLRTLYVTAGTVPAAPPAPSVDLATLALQWAEAMDADSNRAMTVEQIARVGGDDLPGDLRKFAAALDRLSTSRPANSPPSWPARNRFPDNPHSPTDPIGKGKL